MFRKKLILVCSLVLVVLLSLSACGKSDSKGSSSKNSKSNTSTADSKKAFKNKVAKICGSVDTSVFDQINNASTSFDADPEAFQQAFQDGEDELDRVISALDDVDAPAEYDDDWEILIDDFSAIRDAYPKIGKALGEILKITEDASSSLDPSTISDAQKQIEDIQNEIEASNDDLSQRATEIGEIVDRLGINSCNFEK